METIKKYLETLFSAMPLTAETIRLREDMTIHMEEKYNELKASGKTENEAIGVIISEFGSIEEIATEMGVSLSLPEKESDNILKLEDVRSFFTLSQKAAVLTGIGVLLCLLGSASLIGISTLTTMSVNSGSVGVVVLLIFIAIAVGLFIYAEALLGKFSFLEKNIPFTLTPEALGFTRTTKDAYLQKQLVGTILGVVGILLGVIIFMLFSSSDQATSSTLGVIILLIIIGFSVATLIISSGTGTAADKLLEEGDYSNVGKTSNHVIGIVAAVWWPLSTVIFLLWGFLVPNGFAISWVVWPVSGILFGAFAAVYSLVSKGRQN